MRGTNLEVLNYGQGLRFISLIPKICLLGVLKCLHMGQIVQGVESLQTMRLDQVQTDGPVTPTHTSKHRFGTRYLYS
jgi:hypothetical protein